jgi:hypothetical protein
LRPADKSLTKRYHKLSNDNCEQNKKESSGLTNLRCHPDRNSTYFEKGNRLQTRLPSDQPSTSHKGDIFNELPFKKPSLHMRVNETFPNNSIVILLLFGWTKHKRSSLAREDAYPISRYRINRNLTNITFQSGKAVVHMHE